MAKRISFNALSALFLLLCVAAAVLWARSYWVSYLATYAHNHSQGQVWYVSDQGRLIITRLKGRSPDHGPCHWDGIATAAGAFADELNGFSGARFGGFVFFTIAEYGLRRRVVAVPDWALVLGFLAFAVACRCLAITARAADRRRKGLCQRCAYDLRGSPERCPECGRAAALSQPNSLRWTARAAAPLATLSICAMGAILWWSNPVRGANMGPGADPDHGIDFYPVWQPAQGTSLHRMHRNDDWGQEWYQAIWHHPDGDLLVVIYQGPLSIHMYYDFWRVAALDRSLHVVKLGQVGLNGNPYQLVEIRSDDPDTPASARGKWLLGVQWHWQREPSNFPGMDPDPDNDSGFAQNWVNWADAGQPDRQLPDPQNATTRPAELGGF